jgi:chemosensory pili system protein ChpA (sensor histidine kinase/response regulator)
MDSLQQDTSLPSDDLSALAWVHEELRKSLDLAHKALHRCLKDATAVGVSDMDALDPAVLRTARQQVHQGVGALELAGLPAGATVLRASEAVIQKLINRPQLIDEDVVREVERASFALLDYIARRLAGKTVSAMAMFPQYEALVARAGGGMARPTDLWSQDWPTLSLEAPLAPPEGVTPRAPDAATVEDFEMGLLKLMRRNQPEDAVALSELCASLASEASQRQASRECATWMLASGFLEALAGKHVPLSVHAKRVLSSLLSQLRVLTRGQEVPSDRLASELLFFCAQAGDVPTHERSVLARVRRTFGLARHKPVNLSASSLGRFDPTWVTQAIKRVAGAKDGWSAVAGGELLRLGGLNEQFALVCDSLRRLFVQGDVLATALAEAAQKTVATASAPEPSLAMEVATSLLYVEASLEDGEFDQPDQQARLQRLAERIQSVGQGQAAHPLEGWMEDLYRRVSDRHTIGSVVDELRTTLTEAEKHIDQFFRDSQDRTPLVPVPGILQSMRGVLAVLGLDLAAQASVRMRDDVGHLLLETTDLEDAAQRGVFDRLASNLGALGFLIDMMGVQPHLAKSLFKLDPETGVLSPVMGREKKALPHTDDPVEAVAQHVQQVQQEEALAVADEVTQTLGRGDASLDEVSDQLNRLAEMPHVQDQPELAGSLAAAQAALVNAQSSDDQDSVAAAREQVAHVLSDLTRVEEPEPEVITAPVPLLAPVVATAPAETGLEEDDEMREIFLEEAREVIETALASLEQLSHQADDLEALTSVRRAFHTLKGSSRMVGLNQYGEAAWACEQLFNTWLASQEPAGADLLGVSNEVLAHFSVWTDAIAEGQAGGWRHEPVTTVAEALRLQGQRLSLRDVLQAASPAPVSAEQVSQEMLPAQDVEPELMDVADTAEVAEGEFTFTEIPVPQEAVDSFELDLSAEDLGVPPATPAASELPMVNIADFGIELDLSVPATDASTAVLGSDWSSASSTATSGDAEMPAVGEVSEIDDEPVLSVNILEPKHVVQLEDDDPTVSGDLYETPAGDLSEAADALSLASSEETQVEVQALPDLLLDDMVAEPQEAAALPDATVEVSAEDASVGALPEEDVLQDLPLESVGEAADVPEQTDLVDAESSDEQYKVVGDLRIGIPLFNIYLNEADEQSRRLSQALAEWALQAQQPVTDEMIALAHSLAGNSGTVGYTELSRLARLLEHALMRCQALGAGEVEATALFTEAAEEARRLLHQFAAGFLKSPSDDLMARLEDYEHEASRRYEARSLVADQEEVEADLDELEQLCAADHAAQEQAAEDEAFEEPVPDSTETDIDLSVVQDVVPLGLAEFKAFDEAPVQTASSAASRSSAVVWDDGEAIDAVDSVDVDLFPIFEEEALELLPQLGGQIRDWLDAPDSAAVAGTACMRTLHTFKGGARLAGAMRLGELAHRLESTIEHLVAAESVSYEDVAPLEARVDRLLEVFEALRQQDAQTYEAQEVQAAHSVEQERQASEEPVLDGAVALDQAVMRDEWPSPALESVPTVAGETASADAVAQDAAPRRISAREAAELKLTPVDWTALDGKPWQGSRRTVRETQQGVSQVAVRVRPQLLDRLVNHAGEVSITRTRLSSQVGQIRTSLNDLTENLERLRLQLRDIELQADTQMSTRMEAARAASQEFDPLEFDRYTRFQELTRMMAESVNDVATVQRTLQRSLETAEDQLAVQARLTRDLQDDLLRTRMVEFEGLSDRLYRVVRQAAKETGKQVRLDIVGGATEVDRGVLERLTGAFEHLLRNCISHGIEMPDERLAAGKEASGLVTVALRQEGNEVAIEFRDDGAGLNLAGIRKRAVATGLLQDGQTVTDAELAQFIFMPGFSTFDKVTELAGRGIGMDVVRSEINGMGGRIETATSAGRGTSFTLVVPLTTAVTKVVMMRCGAHVVAVPTHLIEIVRRAKPDEVKHAYQQGSYIYGDHALPFYWLGALLDLSPRSHETGRTLPLVVIRSAQQRVALHVDEVLGNQEVVVKNLGVQMSRMPGLAGMTLLASGAVSLIYNPVALATIYGTRAQALTSHALAADSAAGDGWAQSDTPGVVIQGVPDEVLAPLVLVVDDSLTVRRVTQRLLVREGYRVTLAKDGLEALEVLAQERPSVVLSDIEMPRMDGFDLVRNIRADARIADMPVIMITSRIAQKHRDYAEELGVNHYLGKPYGEEELLELVGRYTTHPETAA